MFDGVLTVIWPNMWTMILCEEGIIVGHVNVSHERFLLYYYVHDSQLATCYISVHSEGISVFIHVDFCVLNEKSNLLTWAIRLVFPDPVTFIVKIP